MNSSQETQVRISNAVELVSNTVELVIQSISDF